MQKFSPQTSSFVILSSLCLIGGFLVVLISSHILQQNFVIDSQDFAPKNTDTQPTNTSPVQPVSDLNLPDSSNWPTFHSPIYGLSFRFPPNWKITTPKKQNDYQMVYIDPGKKFYNITVYISSKDFYVMDGLPATKTTVGGAPALNVSNLLYGVTANGYFFTFDAGKSLSLTPQFNALVKSVTFTK